MNELAVLKGKTLKSVVVGKRGDKDKIPSGSSAYGGVFGQNVDTIAFVCEEGTWTFLADGDCCSQSYIDSVDGPKSGKILDVEQPEWGDAIAKDETDDGLTQFYRTTLLIEGKGRLDIEYRNESNGYYGGSLSLLEGPASPSSSREKP